MRGWDDGESEQFGRSGEHCHVAATESLHCGACMS